MKWLKIIYHHIKRHKKRNVMAKITLDDHSGNSFEFTIEDLIFISFDPATKNIVVCLKNQSPKYLPLTPGNISFLRGWVIHETNQLSVNLKKAEQEFLELSDKKGLGM